MIKKIVVLAAGKGTRMLEHSKDQPKHLINVGDKPFLYYHFKNLKDAGFEEIIVVVGYKKEAMEKFAEKYGNEFNLKLVDQIKKIGEEKYGTACPVVAVEEAVGQENFIVANADDLFATEDLEEIKKLDDNYCYLGGLKHKEPQNFGVLKIDGNYLEKILEKPRVGIDINTNDLKNSLVNVGLYKFTPEIFKTVKQVKKSPRGEYELTDAISILAQEKKVKVFPIKKYWLTFSRPADIKKMEEFLLK